MLINIDVRFDSFSKYNQDKTSDQKKNKKIKIKFSKGYF